MNVRPLRPILLVCLAGFVSLSLPAFAANHVVTANPDNTFDPADLTIVEGDTVTWMNNGGFHNVKADDDSFRCAEGCDGEGGNGDPSASAWSFMRQFDVASVIPYQCEVHVALGMTGTLTVLPSEIFTDGFETGGTGNWSVIEGVPTKAP